MRPAGPKPPVPHQARFTDTSGDSRICPNCGITCVPEHTVCRICHFTRPPTGWALVVPQGVLPLDDASEWVIEARLRPSGPVLRHRVRCQAGNHSDSVGVLHIVNDAAVSEGLVARADALAAVEHVTVQTPLRTGRHRGRPYRIDALCTAPRLSTRLAATPSQRRQLLLQLAEGVAVLHRHGVVHGNIGPRRVAWVDAPDGPRPLLLSVPAISAGPWQPEASPEMLRGSAADPRADVFGLGLVFWALVTGRDPRHESRSTWADERPGAVLTIDEGAALSDEERTLLCAMLDRDPMQRPQDMDAVLTQLRGPVVTPSRRKMPVPRPLVAPPKPPPSLGRTRVRLAMAAVGVMGMAGLVVGSELWSPGEATPAMQVEVDALRTAAPPVYVEQTPGAPAQADAVTTTSRDRPTTPTARPVDVAQAAAAPPRNAPSPRPEQGASGPPRAGNSEGSSDPTAAPAGTHLPPDPDSTTAAAGGDLPDSSTASAAGSPPAPELPGLTSDALAGAWSGTVSGRPASLQLYTRPDGRLSGFASIRVGARPEQHPIKGRYRINDNHTISVSLIVQGTSTAWTGRVIDGRFTGEVLYNAKARGEYSFRR